MFMNSLLTEDLSWAFGHILNISYFSFLSVYLFF